MEGRWGIRVSVYFLSCVFLIGNAEGHVKLNVPRVRLPYFETLSVNFTLKVDTPGCYTWSLSRTDVVVISPSKEPENSYELDGILCSDSAVISTIPRVSPCCPANAIVFAEDVVTKEIVRCDVIIDKITAIEILTTTKELHLEEAPSKFHIQGYGSKDNELSTLDGVPFSWLLESPKNRETLTVVDPQSIMRFIPFSESPYKAPSGVATLEARRLQGDTILMEGIKTGSAEIIARVNDPFYKGLESRVRIVVVASLHVEPHEVFVVPGTVLPMSLWQMKHGKKFEIKLPSTVYEFQVDNSTVASYDPKKSQLTALDYGEAKIVVTDKNCLDELEEHPEALISRIHVRQPKYLSLTIFPHRNWAVVLGQTYEIQVDIYDSNNQKILVKENVFVETTFDPMYFRVDYSSANGTYHYGVPIRGGSAYVTAILKKIVLADNSEVVPSPQPRVKSEMEIFQNIALNPKETILPWDPNVMPKYELRWHPSGGNGNFVWSTTNTSVVTVSQSATGKSEWFGSANVTAASSVNPHIKGVARVHILPPTKMKIVEHIAEAEIGTVIQVPLAFYTIRPNDPNKTEVPYSSCGKLPINVQVEDPNFVYDAKTHYPNLKPACVVIPVIGNVLGSSLVQVTYSMGDKHFEDSVIVSTFKPLNTIEPEKDFIVLAVGSTKQIVFEGGPRPLLEKHAGFIKTLKLDNDTVASHRSVKVGTGLKDDFYVYEVLCKELGTTTAMFEIGNSQLTEMTPPITRRKVVEVICAEPAKMYFKVESAVKTKCPNDGSSAQVVRVAVPNYEPTKISVTVKDASGRAFDNITSLLIDWKSDPGYLDFATGTYAVTEPLIKTLGYVDTGKGLQTVLPHGKSGNVVLTATVKGYRQEVLKHYNIPMKKLAITEKDEFFELEHSMDLQFVSDVAVDPAGPISLFNHPSTKMALRVKDGSGYFQVDTEGNQKINVTYDETEKTIQIKPIQQGKGRVVIRDLCVSTKKDTYINVDVTGIGKIEVVTDDKIPLNGDKLLTVSVYDQSGKLLPVETVKLIHLSLRPMATNVLDITPLEVRGEAKDSRIQFNVKGKGVGVADVVFSADGRGDKTQGAVFSSPKSIYVFPPLKLSPKEVTVLMGNSFKVTAVDGPADADVKFSIDKKDIANVDTFGELKALSLGKSLLRGRAVDPESGRMYSEDSVQVNVVPLSGLKIVSPLQYLYENEKMPIWVKGLAGKVELSPHNLATASPPLERVQWIVSNVEYADIRYVFEEKKEFPVGDDLRTQFHSKKTGNVTLQVVAFYNGVRVVSQKIDVDIRQYPYGQGGTSQSGPEEKGWFQFSLFFLNTFLYWCFLPVLLAISVAMGCITYNSYMYSGVAGSNTASVDTSLFITNPQYANMPLRYSPSPPHSINGSPSSQFAMADTAAGNLQHHRLYSTSDSGLYSRGSKKTPDR